MNWFTQLRVVLCCVVAAAGLTSLASMNAAGSPTTRPSETARANQIDCLPHISINTNQGYVDLDATVNLREGGWLELLACTPTSRTHESILVVHAKPSHVHLALQMIGLEPGAPMKWKNIDDQYIPIPASGPKIVVSLIFTQKGQTITVPANQWVVNRKTHQPLDSPIWLFTGSSFDETRNPPVYRADVEGSVLSLVHFGDEVLARCTTQTNQSDNGLLQPRTDEIPEVGTPVKIRLRPVEPAK